MSTKKAFRVGFFCTLIIAKNIGKAIDRFVHRFPWACLILISLTMLLIGFTSISDARKERDALSLENYKMQATIDSLKIAYDAKCVRNLILRKGTPIKLGVASINN